MIRMKFFFSYCVPRPGHIDDFSNQNSITQKKGKQTKKRGNKENPPHLFTSLRITTIFGIASHQSSASHHINRRLHIGIESHHYNIESHLRLHPLTRIERSGWEKKTKDWRHKHVPLWLEPKFSSHNTTQ